MAKDHVMGRSDRRRSLEALLLSLVVVVSNVEAGATVEYGTDFMDTLSPSRRKEAEEAFNFPSGDHDDSGHHEPSSGHEGSEHDHPDDAYVGRLINVSVACSMMGGILFIMGIFYMVNHPDSDMRLYSWEALSSTVSIFIAVSFFHAFSSMKEVVAASLTRLFDGDEGGMLEESIDASLGMLHLCFWFVALQVITVYVASKIYEKRMAGPDRSESERMLTLAPNSAGMPPGHGSGPFDFNDEEERLMLCVSTLLSHITAFAAIHAGGWLQQASSRSVGPLTEARLVGPLLCALSTGVFFVGLFGLFRITDFVRGKHDFVPKAVHHLQEEHVTEAENELGALAISFLVVQCLRYLITGVLPGPEGDEEEAVDHGIFAILLLLLCGFSAIAGRVAMIRFGPMIQKHLEEAEVLHHWVAFLIRWVLIANWILLRCFSWCLLFSLSWTVEAGVIKLDLIRHGITSECTSVRFVLAFLVSIIAFGGMRILDLISDSSGSEATHYIIRNIIRSIGFLVGFCWEQAFSRGIERISSLRNGGHHEHFKVEKPWLTELMIALVIAVVVAPAWSWYIVPKLMHMQQTKQKEFEQEHAAVMGQGQNMMSVLSPAEFFNTAPFSNEEVNSTMVE